MCRGVPFRVGLACVAVCCLILYCVFFLDFDCLFLFSILGVRVVVRFPGLVTFFMVAPCFGAGFVFALACLDPRAAFPFPAVPTGSSSCSVGLLFFFFHV